MVATTYSRMGLLAEEHPENWYDPGRFWSGDGLQLRDGATLSAEVRVIVPPLPGEIDADSAAGARQRRDAARAWWAQNAERVRRERLSPERFSVELLNPERLSAELLKPERLTASLRSAAEMARRAAEQTVESAETWRGSEAWQRTHEALEREEREEREEPEAEEPEAEQPEADPGR